MVKFNVRVEYESTPIRHIAVQCPECQSWFYGNDITEGEYHLGTSFEIYMATFLCPLCGCAFGNSNKYYVREPAITECSYPEVYDGIKEKKVTWE